MRSKETASYRRSCFLTAFGIALAAVSQNADISRAAVTQNGDNSANPTAAGADPIIGINNLGRLNITGGDSVTSDVVVIGDLLNGIGLVTVTDFNPGTAATSTWTTNSLMVGDAGTGRLEILNGAIVSVDFSGTPATGDFVIGNLASAVGTVIVDGLGSMLRLGDDTVIGQAGTGILKIRNEGYVVGTNSAAGDTDIFTIGVQGRVELDNGRLRNDTFVNHGMIVGSGRLDSVSALANAPTGHIEVNPGDRLEVSAVMDNGGNIALKGGEINFLKAVLDSGPSAEITLRDGAVARFLSTGFGFDSLSGVLASTAGTNDIHGTVRIQTSASKISVSGGSTAVFHDPVTNAGGTIEVFAGSTIVYLQGLTTTGSSSALALTLADPETGNDSGAIEVSGNVSLAGNLTVNLITGFEPSAGGVFPILVAAGSVTGSLNLVGAPVLPGGMQWDLDINSSNVLLRVVATGDYNGNGVVDSADYVVWRNSQNQQGAGLAADSNGDGMVNVADYNFWRSRVGNVVGSGLGAGAAVVPEPAAMAFVAVGGALASIVRRRARPSTC
jgi:T5SS/PEP-CTERM-associated repeat protein